ncbi:TetR/AcrR family transcriptional regulator [Nocardia testacea]|uniref:TetR/AcrR family transcriptional regulator n=1 Tax=Nocardia testacea TaxID=248551 RepID=UPI003C2BA6D6
MTAPPAPNSARADARRNRELVLRTAVHLFTDEGPEVSIGRIAQRAGVGAGTVYRHFPSKEVLVEAVLAEHVAGLARAADRWAQSAPPGDALYGFLLEVIEKSAGRKQICDALTADRSWPHALLATAARQFDASLRRLLHQAKRAGAVGPEIEVADLTALTVGGAAIWSAHRSRARGARLVRQLLEVVRTTTVTEGAVLRDGEGARRHETGRGRHCAECGTRLRDRTTGRPARYCGPTCRQRGHRRRAGR